MHIIMIANQKGGVGKTSLTLELCNQFGLAGKKVLGIDLDPQTNFTLYSGAYTDESPEKTIRTALNGECLLEDVIINLENFDLAPGDKQLFSAAKEFGEPDDIYLLSDILEDAGYDYVLIDSAPGRSPLLYMSYVASDYILAPTECDDGSIGGLYEIKADVDRFKKRGQSKVEILGIVLNKYENTTMHKIAIEDLEEVAKALETTVFDTTIRKSIVVSEAKTVRRSVGEYKKSSNVANDYKNLCKEIERRIR